MAYQCFICVVEDTPLNKVGRVWLCPECEEEDYSSDIETYEEDKRRKIAEDNEY